MKKAGKTKSQFMKAVKEIEAYILDPNAPVITVSTPKPKKSLPESDLNNTTISNANDESIQEDDTPAPTKKTPVQKRQAVKTPQPKKTKASVKSTEDMDEVIPPKRSRKDVSSPIGNRSNHINNNNDISQDGIKSDYTPIPKVNRVARAVIDRPIDFLNLPEQVELDVTTITETLKSKKIKPSKQKFGFIGLGIMGSGIVKNLINSGHDVCVYNRTQDKTTKFEKAGAKVMLTPSDVIEYADITFSCVADPEALKNVSDLKFITSSNHLIESICFISDNIWAVWDCFTFTRSDSR